MFLIYPNEAHTYRGYSNLTEFQMLYKCESDMGKHTNPFFAPADEDESAESGILGHGFEAVRDFL